jgi:hypothetical protein
MLSHGLIAVFWALLAYSVIACVLDQVCIGLGLHHARAIYVNVLFFTTRSLALVGGLVCAWRARRRSAQWDRPTVKSMGCLAAALLAAVFCLLACWFPFFNMEYSETEVVPPFLIERHLPVNLPARARNVYFFSDAGIDPGCALRFTAEPDEARSFLGDVLHAEGMGQADLRSPTSQRVSRKPSGFSGDEWWEARDDLPWYYKAHRHGQRVFIQLDEDTYTIYFGAWSI